MENTIIPSTRENKELSKDIEQIKKKEDYLDKKISTKIQ